MPADAAALYECLLQDTLDLMRQTPAVQPAIAYLPPGAETYFTTLAPDFELILQDGPDLARGSTTRWRPTSVVASSGSPS